MKQITEPAQTVNLAHECDICVIGGSCTGVFAAIRAAREGASVALIEQQGVLGGVATASLVPMWHNLYDIDNKEQIIGGLSHEVIKELDKLGATSWQENRPLMTKITFNPFELMIILDRLLLEAGIRVFLHAKFCRPLMDDDRQAEPKSKLKAVIIEDKSGRRAISAKYFIDATGDADVIDRLGLSTYKENNLQPPSTPVMLRGMKKWYEANPGVSLNDVFFNSKYRHSISKGFVWSTPIPGMSDMAMICGTRVHGADCSDADDLTDAELEGRRQVRSIVTLLQENFKGAEDIAIAGLPGHIGIRQTRQINALHKLTEEELLTGVRFDDTIARGTYPVDIHNGKGGGITFRLISGEERILDENLKWTDGRWLEEGKAHAPYYCIPYRSLVPKGAHNILAAGRSIDADKGAFGAIRVMINCNQTGEAAGIASVMAMRGNYSVAEINTETLRKKLGLA